MGSCFLPSRSRRLIAFASQGGREAWRFCDLLDFVLFLLVFVFWFCVGVMCVVCFVFCVFSVRLVYTFFWWVFSTASRVFVFPYRFVFSLTVHPFRIARAFRGTDLLG